MYNQDPLKFISRSGIESEDALHNSRRKLKNFKVSPFLSTTLSLKMTSPSTSTFTAHLDQPNRQIMAHLFKGIFVTNQSLIIASKLHQVISGPLLFIQMLLSRRAKNTLRTMNNDIGFNLIEKVPIELWDIIERELKISATKEVRRKFGFDLLCRPCQVRYTESILDEDYDTEEEAEERSVFCSCDVDMGTLEDISLGSAGCCSECRD